MATLSPAAARAASGSHSRSPSTPPLPRSYSPAPSQPRDQLDAQQKERDRLLWQARWNAYEDRKAAWLQASWAEYEKRKETDIATRWKEYDDVKREMMNKWAEMELSGKRVKGAFPPLSAEEAKAWAAASSSAPSVRISTGDAGKALPIAPTPVRTSAASPLSRTRSTRSPTPLTPPPIYRTSPPVTPTASRSAYSTPPRSPTRASTTPVPRSSSQRSTPSPILGPNFFTPTSAVPNLYFPPPPSPLFNTSTSSQQQARSRSNTNPTAAKPQIFMPKPIHASDSDVPLKADELLTEEKRRRAADEKRRMEQASEHARRKKAETEQWYQQREAERKKEARADKARFGAKKEKEAPKRAASHRRRPSAPDSFKEDQQRLSADQARKDADALQRAYLQQQHHLVHSAWEAYEERWKAMYGGFYPPPGAPLMALGDVPWPVVGEIRSAGELDRGRLEGFLLWEGVDGGRGKAMKQRVRDAMLRFHPDRFEGRWMSSVRESDRAAVKEGVGRVVRFLTEFSNRLA